MMSVTIVLFTFVLGVAGLDDVATVAGHSGVVDGAGEFQLFSSVASPGKTPNRAAAHTEEGVVVSGVQGLPEKTQLLRVHAEEDEYEEPPQQKLLRVHEEEEEAKEPQNLLRVHEEEEQESSEEPQNLLRVHEEEETTEAEKPAHSFFQIASAEKLQQPKAHPPRLVRVHEAEEEADQQPQEKSPTSKKSRLARTV